MVGVWGSGISNVLVLRILCMENDWEVLPETPVMEGGNQYWAEGNVEL